MTISANIKKSSDYGLAMALALVITQQMVLPFVLASTANSQSRAQQATAATLSSLLSVLAVPVGAVIGLAIERVASLTGKKAISEMVVGSFAVSVISMACLLLPPFGFLNNNNNLQMVQWFFVSFFLGALAGCAAGFIRRDTGAEKKGCLKILMAMALATVLTKVVWDPFLTLEMRETWGAAGNEDQAFHREKLFLGLSILMNFAAVFYGATTSLPVFAMASDGNRIPTVAVVAALLVVTPAVLLTAFFGSIGVTPGVSTTTACLSLAASGFIFGGAAGALAPVMVTTDHDQASQQVLIKA